MKEEAAKEANKWADLKKWWAEEAKKNHSK